MPEFNMPISFIGRPYAEKRFCQIVNHAFANNPFYRRFYASVPDVPLLTREILQEHNDELLNGHAVTGKTSGATSVPVCIHWAPPRAKLEGRDSSNYAEWFGGRLPNMKIVALTAHKASENTLEVASKVPVQLQFIQRQMDERGVRSLISYPTNLEQLAQHLIQAGQQIVALQRIVCMSELFEPSQEALIRQAFPNAQIAATYSSTEVGMIAGRCPHNPENYHMMAHKLGIEFLNAEGQPCRQGEVGQIVITDYANRKMPLIRYAIGDLAAPISCHCGKIPLPALTNLLGKQRGILKHPNGGNVFSTELSAEIRDTPGIRQFQVIQRSTTRIQLRLIARPDAVMAEAEQGLRALFERVFGQALQLDFDWCDEIPRLPGGKYMEFIELS
ncbi:MAG: phenylacetate--CoA ligase family protein [Arenimonas sp.]|nr:phenylacetate--CoA ligase family protein [Arenimonas sp.]